MTDEHARAVAAYKDAPHGTKNAALKKLQRITTAMLREELRQKQTAD